MKFVRWMSSYNSSFASEYINVSLHGQFYLYCTSVQDVSEVFRKQNRQQNKNKSRL